jgi:hypothetical protein
VLLFVIIFYIYSCKKDSPIRTPPQDVPIENCPNAYDGKSLPYDNLYKGTIATQCTFSPSTIYLEKFIYSHVCINPNNPYEIAYIKRENNTQPFNNFELCKFDFCSGMETMLAKMVGYSPNWSVKNWIIYTGIDNQLWKVKSNGDSLTQLTNTGNFNNNAKWNLSGTNYLYKDASLGNINNMMIANADGTQKLAINQTMSIWDWRNDSCIVFSNQFSNTNPIEVRELNIINNNVTIIKTINLFGNFSAYHSGTNSLILNEYVNQNSSKMKVYYLDDDNFELLSNNTPSYSTSSVNILKDNKILYQRILKDTLTGNPCKLNFRSHIAIMNIDGTNERQVIFPE